VKIKEDFSLRTGLMLLFGGGQIIFGIFKGYVNWQYLGWTLVLIYVLTSMRK